MKRLLMAISLIFVLIFPVPSLSRAQSAPPRPSRIEPTKDTYIVKNNHEGHNKTSLLLASTKSNDEYRTDYRILLDFDVSSIPEDSSVTSAILKLTLVSPIGAVIGDGDLTQIFAYRQEKQGWDQAQSDWFSLNGDRCNTPGGSACWETPGSDIIYSPGVPERQGGTYNVAKVKNVRGCNLGICSLEFDASDFIEDARMYRNNRVSLAIRSEHNDPLSARFYSREHVEIDYRPVLKLQYDGELVSPSCPVDITFVVDNSGSMDDKGADLNLKRLTDNLEGYFREDFASSTASLYWFARNREGVKIIDRGDDDSLRVSLARMFPAPFGGVNEEYNGSDFRHALRVATERAIANSNNGRAQFIFFAGDEQTDYPRIRPPAAYWDLIAEAGRKGIIFYTFDLRPGAKNSIRDPYKYIANRSGGSAFRGAHFNDRDALKMALRDNSCKITGHKFNDSNDNGQRDVGEIGLGGWKMRLHSVEDASLSLDVTTWSDSDRPGYFEFTNLNKNLHYWVEEIFDENQLAENWRQTTPPESKETAATLAERPIRDIGNIRGTVCATECNPPLPVVTTEKSVSRSVITGTQTSTNVTVSALISGAAITKFKLTEKLAPGFVYGDNPSVRAVYIAGNTGESAEIELKSPPPQSGQSSDWVIEPNEVDRVFQPGLVQVTFQLRYTRTQNGNFPVDLIVADNCQASAHLEYQSTTSTAIQCVSLPPGEITRRNFALTITGDALLQDRTSNLVFDGQTLKVGQNSLVVLGGSNNPGVPLKINNYDVPVSGKLHWQSIWNELNQRIDRAKVTMAQEIACPGRLDGNMYLKTDRSNFSEPPQNPSLSRPRIWIIPATPPCRLEVGTVALHGTGTIVNLGGVTQFKGKITGDTSDGVDGLAVISSLDPSRSQRESSEEDIIILDQAEPNLTALITNGRLVMAKRDRELTDDSLARPIDYSSYLIGGTLRFPKRGGLRGDITISPATNLKQYIPPLLEHFKLPAGKSLQ